MLIKETTVQVGNGASSCRGVHTGRPERCSEEHLNCEEAGVQGVSRLRDHSKPIQHRLTEQT